MVAVELHVVKAQFITSRGAHTHSARPSPQLLSRGRLLALSDLFTRPNSHDCIITPVLLIASTFLSCLPPPHSLSLISDYLMHMLSIASASPRFHTAAPKKSPGGGAAAKKGTPPVKARVVNSDDEEEEEEGECVRELAAICECCCYKWTMHEFIMCARTRTLTLAHN